MTWRILPYLIILTIRDTRRCGGLTGNLALARYRARDGDWQIKKGETETIRHQLVVYTGEFNDVALTDAWSDIHGTGLFYL